MKSLLILAAMAALSGCAVVPPPYYAARAPQPVYDPYQCHTVSAEPDGTSYAPVASAQPSVAYATAPVYAAPVYVAAPYYAPAPYYYPPVSIGLDFMVGGWCCHRGGWGRYHRR